jgi:hypothetical protein
MRRFLLLCCLAALAFAALPAASAAATATAGEPSSPSITVPIDTAVFGDPGSVHELATVAVDVSLVANTCTVSAVANNNQSVHPGSDLTVASGDSSVEVLDVEASPGAITTGDGTLVLGAQLTVSVTLGTDGVFSGGVEVTLTCQSPPPPTEPPTTEPATPVPPTATVPDVPTASVTLVEVPLVVAPATPVPAQPATAG